MVRRQLLLVGLLLAGLVACGGAPTTSAGQPLADPTATATPAALRAGGGAPTVAPVSTAPRIAPKPGATPTPMVPTPATAAGGTTPQPNGPIPAGWQVYRGPAAFPIVVAYPPDWVVDDALLPGQRVVYLIGPDGRGAVERIDIALGQTGSGANIDVQRDAFFRRHSDFCAKKGIEYTAHRPLAGVIFAILGATCDASNELSFMQVATGLRGGDEWDILMRTPYARKEERLREVFDPLLASLTIYAAAP